SFVRYQARMIRALDRMAKKYGFEVLDANRSPDEIFEDLQRRIETLFHPRRTRARRKAEETV
ncbi:MAG: hypothetical protein HY822_22930, partial [Acidobacteria bacterium]|nr:hypothetical protein [Acidobacteriota bacterium]